jgi:hypothetical protein
LATSRKKPHSFEEWKKMKARTRFQVKQNAANKAKHDPVAEEEKRKHCSAEEKKKEVQKEKDAEKAGQERSNFHNQALRVDSHALEYRESFPQTSHFAFDELPGVLLYPSTIIIRRD